MLRPTAVYDTLWRFASARQEAYVRRLAGLSPYTNDPIIAQHRFTNCYRVADRVSQYLIRNVIQPGEHLAPRDQVFRILLFKIFNKIETWESMYSMLRGQVYFENITNITWVLNSLRDTGETLYSAAYMMPSPNYGATTKLLNHLAWLNHFCSTSEWNDLLHAQTMQHAFAVLRRQRGLGDFLAFQYLIDINYSSLLNFDENAFIVPGPGALDGIKKCFGHDADPVEAIWCATAYQDREFASRGLPFQRLLGRSLHLIDMQNLFCEIDKYARLAHPEVPSRRTKIKQSYKPSSRPLDHPVLPAKWLVR